MQANDPFASSAQLLPVQPESRPRPRPAQQPVRVPTGMPPPLAGPLPSIFGEPQGEKAHRCTCMQKTCITLHTSVQGAPVVLTCTVSLLGRGMHTEDAPLQPLSSGLALPAAGRPTADNPLGPLGAMSQTPSQGSAPVRPPTPLQPPSVRPAGPPPGDYHQQVQLCSCPVACYAVMYWQLLSTW